MRLAEKVNAWFSERGWKPFLSKRSLAGLTEDGESVCCIAPPAAERLLLSGSPPCSGPCVRRIPVVACVCFGSLLCVPSPLTPRLL